MQTEREIGFLLELIIASGDGYICRDREMMNVWTIEINSIEELIALSRKYGKIIIADYYLNDNDGYPTLEIYDSYRE